MTTTLQDVQTLARRVAALQAEAAGLEGREGELTRRIAERHASGDGEVDDLTVERRAVRERRADLLASLPLIEERLVAERETAGTAAARERAAGIARAHGSLRDQLDKDADKLRAAAQAYAEVVAQLGERYAKLTTLQAEAHALADRFGVEAPQLAPVVPPLFRDDVQAVLRLLKGVAFADRGDGRQAFEHDEHKIRRRRTYREAGGTPGYEIIERAGLKPWVSLTETQARIVAARRVDAEQERSAVERFEAEVAGERAVERFRTALSHRDGR